MNIENIVISFASVIGGGFVGGILLGYFIKKIMKILMFVIGGILILLLFLQNQDIIKLNHDKLDNSLVSLTMYLTNTIDSIIQSDSLTVPVTASTSAGFVIGLKI
jgi:uncharacterized membrane protein (Fun14 family)